MLTKEGATRSFAPGGVAAAETRDAGSGFQDGPDIAAVTSRLERVEQYVRASTQPPRPAWREPALLPPDYRDNQYEAAPGPALLRARRNTGISPWLFVMATALNTMVAALLAVIITLGVVEGQSRESQAAAIPGAPGVTRVSTGYAMAEAPRTAGTQPLTVRPIGSPNQPLRLEARKPMRLPLQIVPDNAALEPFIMVLAGAPAGTTLSGGASRMGSDTWFVPGGSANRLEITLPEWSSAPIEMAIELRRTNGAVAAQTTAWFAVPPPGGGSETTTGMGSDQAAARELLVQGGRLIERGEIVAARSVYQRAAEMGSGEAALALGATYDPNRLWALGAMGMVGNRERAKHWYARANDLGHPEAGARMKLLGN
jgi:hypothetical protein